MSKFCSNCGKELNDNSEFCLGCGIAIEKNKSNVTNNNKKFPVWLIVVLVILGVAFIGFVFGDDSETDESGNLSNESTNNEQNSNNSGNNNSSTKKEKLSLEEGHYGYSDDYGFAYYIEGYINNNTNKDYSYVQVSFIAYDSDGNTVGSCYDNNGGLQTKGRWKFKALCSGEAEEIVRYELDTITGW